MSRIILFLLDIALWMIIWYMLPHDNTRWVMIPVLLYGFVNYFRGRLKGEGIL